MKLILFGCRCLFSFEYNSMDWIFLLPSISISSSDEYVGENSIQSIGFNDRIVFEHGLLETLLIISFT